MLAASWTPGASTSTARWGLRTDATGSTEQEQTLMVGAVRWRRLALAVGPQLRLLSPSQRWIVDIHVQALASWLSVRGVGFATNRADSTVEPGAAAGIRLMLHRGQLTPWLALGITGWLREQIAYANPGNPSTSLPRLDGMLALGVSFCRCP
jgi:hypothetical protein